ncbi:hypothetical protein B0H17DRAFT_1130221 [Mycena rosella]|uniref:Ig-like domain-containing protein n=1 Tax=Mycena rosella TaxID=1033263 RepID=A0AAD7GJ89_MYCRO|nr:hypothetical protein B0H17DRAFT_1130221 [Mycena rosella]
MFSQMFSLGLLALSVVSAVPTGSETSAFGAPDSKVIVTVAQAASPARAMVPGIYVITQTSGACTVDSEVFAPEGHIHTIPAGDITLPYLRTVYPPISLRPCFLWFPHFPLQWQVERIGADQYNIVSTKYGTLAAGPRDVIGFHTHITLTCDAKTLLPDDTKPTIWAIESAGNGEWIIKVPNTDTVWKYNNIRLDNTISLFPTDGSLIECWVFTRIDRD